MHSSQYLVNSFFRDLKKFNITNFRTLRDADIEHMTDTHTYHKAFSSVITRFFIFKERHPEITDSEANMLYFKLKLDLIAQYFAEYPDANKDSLIAFQVVLNNYVKGDGDAEE